MYTIVQHVHSVWAAITLISLFTVVIMAIMGISLERDFKPISRKVALFGMTFAHIQFLFGLWVYFLSPLGYAALAHLDDPTLRLSALEHPIVGILAIALITIGWSKHKKTKNSDRKFKTIGVYFGLGLVLLLSRVPWHLWL